MADVQWIKLYVNTFNISRKLKQIEQMKGGDTILIIWVKLLCLAGSVNDGGMIYVTPDIPFTVEGLAEELRKPAKVVKNALDVLALYEQIVVDDAGFIKVSSWDKYQNVDRLDELREYNRLAQQRCREKKRAKAVNDNVNDKSMTSQRSQETEEDGEGELEFHSFNHSFIGEKNEDDVSRLDKDRVKRELMGGTLGAGVVMLSDAEVEYLLDELSLDEFNYYVGVVRDCELNGQKYKKKTHFKAIMEMAMKDRKIK